MMEGQRVRIALRRLQWTDGDGLELLLFHGMSYNAG